MGPAMMEARLVRFNYSHYIHCIILFHTVITIIFGCAAWHMGSYCPSQG